jgi:flavodoxin
MFSEPAERTSLVLDGELADPAADANRSQYRDPTTAHQPVATGTPMKTAAIVYHSRTGKTRAFALEIAAFFQEHDIEPLVLSIGECTADTLAGVDYLLLGCWTQGLMIILQRPDDPWVEFARNLPPLEVPRIGLFTTYLIATGGMFRKMRKHLAAKTSPVRLELKSRNGSLSDRHRKALARFVA